MNSNIDKFVELTHKLYQLQRESLSFLLKGENGVLLLLNERSDVTPSLIGKSFKVSSARVATILNSLEKKSYITRKQSDLDKRVTYIELSNLGLKEARLLKTRYYNSLSNFFEELGEKDAKLGLELLEKTVNIIKKSTKGTGY